MEDLSPLLAQIIISAIPVIFAITLHETAHGWVANRLGDPTARLQGRLTLNPIPHIDPVQTILFPIMTLILSHGTFIFGGAKPVPVNFNNLRHPKRDMILVAAAGPGMNLLLAATAGCLFRILTGIRPDIFGYIHSSRQYSASSQLALAVMVPVALIFLAAVKWNILLAVFNMIPIPPLDGGRVMVGLLPHNLSRMLSNVEPFGILIVIALIYLDPGGLLIHFLLLIMQSISFLFIGVNSFLL
ncbi:MAG TPA: site-2 protease family protein [Nitrospiria bacterium]|nr:site-2 protease family protein [Nitrospiria bacterium]